MKKVLIILCVLFCAVGCSCKKENNKIKLNKGEVASVSESSSYLYGEYGMLSYELNGTEEYDNKINNKDSFLLFIYREGCFGCQQLAKAFKLYMDENTNIVLYTMKIDTVGYNHDLYKTENITETPYLILIESGKIIYKEIMPTKVTNPNQAKDWLDDWMDKHIVWEE